MSIASAMARSAALARSLPFPLAYGFSQFAATGDFDAAVFAVEATLRFTCIVVKSAYLSRAVKPSLVLNDAIRRFLFRPSMGQFRAFLHAVRQQPGLVADLGLGSLVGLLETSATRDVARLVQLRNEAQGHPGTQLGESQKAALSGEVVACWGLLLDALGPYERTTLLVRQDDGSWMSYAGTAPTPTELLPAAEGPAPAVLVGLPEGDLPLFPLVVRTFEGYRKLLPGAAPDTLLVFDGLQDDELVYVGQYGRGHGRAWVDHYRALMQHKALPLFPLSHDEAGAAETLRRTRDAFALDRQIAVEHAQIHPEADALDPRTASTIDDFVASPCRTAILVGAAGAGKSTHLFAAGDRALAHGHVPVRLDARRAFAYSSREQHVGVDHALKIELERQTQIVGDSAAALLGHLALAAPVKVPGARVLLLIDGLDEVGSPARGRAILEDLGNWLSRNHVLSGIRVLVSMRSVYFADLAGIWKAPPLPALYRPTRRSATGADAPLDAIVLEAPKPEDLDTVAVRYERYRETSPSHQPLSAFHDLPASVKDACRSPRWMVELLTAFHGKAVPSSVGHSDIWRSRVTRHVYGVTAGQPRYPQRARLADALTDHMLNKGSTSVPEVDLERDAGVGRLLERRAEEGGPLTDLLSENILCYETDGGDVFATRALTPVDDMTAAALLAEGRLFRRGSPEEWLQALRELEDRPLWGTLGRACVMALASRFSDARVDCSVGVTLPPPLFAELVLEVALGTWNDDLARSLATLPAPAREDRLKAVASLGWMSGTQAALRPFAKAIMAWESTTVSDAAISLVARTFRHAEDVEAVERWLESLAAARADLRRVCTFQLAEILRERGLWRRAEEAYGALVAGPDDTTAVLALACRGECRIWLKEGRAALDDLTAALARLDERVGDDVRCNVHLKSGIAARLSRMYPRAVRDLDAAEQVAKAAGFVTERAKVSLEMGLVAVELQLFEEAELKLKEALDRHVALGFVKGRKKAHFCLGYLYHRWDNRTEAAIFHYRASLCLNEQHFDLLGLHRCHDALARLLARCDPAEASLHREQADEFAKRLRQEDRRHGDFTEV